MFVAMKRKNNLICIVLTVICMAINDKYRYAIRNGSESESILVNDNSIKIRKEKTYSVRYQPQISKANNNN